MWPRLPWLRLKTLNLPKSPVFFLDMLEYFWKEMNILIFFQDFVANLTADNNELRPLVQQAMDHALGLRNQAENLDTWVNQHRGLKYTSLRSWVPTFLLSKIANSFKGKFIDSVWVSCAEWPNLVLNEMSCQKSRLHMYSREEEFKQQLIVRAQVAVLLIVNQNQDVSMKEEPSLVSISFKI